METQVGPTPRQLLPDSDPRRIAKRPPDWARPTVGLSGCFSYRRSANSSQPAGRLAPVTYADAKSEYANLGPLQTRIETHLLYSERPEDVEQAVLDAFPREPGDALLDVGSGTGSFLARLRSHGHQGRLVGLDTSPAAMTS